MRFSTDSTILVAVLAAATLTLTACSSSRSASTTDADRTLTTLEASARSTPDLTLDGEMKISGVPATIWFDALVKSRDSLKIVLTGPFGIAAGAMSATPDRLLFYDAMQAEAFEGRPDRRTLGRLLQVELDYSEIVALLRGELPRIPQPGEYQVESVEGRLRYTARAGSVTETFVVRPEPLALESYHRTRSSGEREIEELAVSYENFRVVGNRQFPRRAMVRIADGAQTIRITVENVAVGIDVGRSLTLDIPPGITRRRI